MKIQKEEQKFAPITITIESIEELMALVRLSAACLVRSPFGDMGSSDVYSKLTDIAQSLGVDTDSENIYPTLRINDKED